MWIFIGSCCASWVSVRSSITVKTCFQCVQKLRHHPIYIIMVSDTLCNKHFILFSPYLSLFSLLWLGSSYWFNIFCCRCCFYIHSFIHSLVQGAAVVLLDFISLIVVIIIPTKGYFTVRIYRVYIRHTKWPNERRRLATEIKWQNFVCFKHISSECVPKKSFFKHISRI